ncbi:MAG: hypothetical protein ACRD15_10990, partial [Vicinamibacterales bacterium]
MAVPTSAPFAAYHRSRGEYIVAAARLSVALGLRDVAGVRAALAACVDGGVAPLSVASTARLLVDTYRDDADIDRLLDRLHDGARPVPGNGREYQLPVSRSPVPVPASRYQLPRALTAALPRRADGSAALP